MLQYPAESQPTTTGGTDLAPDEKKKEFKGLNSMWNPTGSEEQRSPS